MVYSGKNQRYSIKTGTEHLPPLTAANPAKILLVNLHSQKYTMKECEVNIKTPVKDELVFDFECNERQVRYSICDSSGFIKLSGSLGSRSPHRISVAGLRGGTYILKLVDGDVWGDNKFDIS
jgi:hypothetical protein